MQQSSYVIQFWDRFVGLACIKCVVVYFVPCFFVVCVNAMSCDECSDRKRKCRCNTKYHFKKLILLAHCIIVGSLSMAVWGWMISHLQAEATFECCTTFLTAFAAIQVLTFGLVHFDSNFSKCKLHQVPNPCLHFLVTIGGGPAIGVAIAFLQYRHRDNRYLRGFIKSCYASLVVILLIGLGLKLGFSTFRPPARLHLFSWRRV